MATAAYIPPLAPAQSGADHQPRTASGRLREIEITQPNQLATRTHLRVPSAFFTYYTLWDATRFDQYYCEQLYEYIKTREQSLAEMNHKHGSFPVCLGRIGKMVFMHSSLADPPADWPLYGAHRVPRMEEVFTPLTDVKQFSGEWTLEGGYSGNVAVPSYGAPANGGSSSNQFVPSYSANIELETPCDITFYQFKTAQTADFDKAVERIVQAWPDVEKRGIVSSLGAARIADVFLVVTDAADTERFDAEVEGLLSPYFNPVIAELFPYPRKSRY